MTYPEALKAISIHAPHAYAICMGIKKAEYRSRATDRRGWILIHASQSKASDGYFADYGIDKSTIKRGAIIGAAFLTDCAWDWELECYAYHLENPIFFEQFIEGIRGCQAIFWGAKSEIKQAAFAKAWEIIQNIEAEDEPWAEASTEAFIDISTASEDIPIEANNDNQPIQQRNDEISIEAIEILGYELKIVEDPYGDWENITYDVLDDMTQEWLFQIYKTTEGWKTGFTRQTYESPQAAIAIAREKAIERLERSIRLEVRAIRVEEPDGYGDAFIVRNKEIGNHYVVRPDHPDPHERCECADALYRGVECKHQLAVKESLESSSPSWRRQAADTYSRMLSGEKLIIDIAVGEAVLKYESDTRFGVNYLCTRKNGVNASTKLIMSEQELEKYCSDLYNPRIIDAFGSANPRFNNQYPIPNTQCPITDIQFMSPDGFYNWEAVANGEIIALISYDTEHLTQPYTVLVEGQIIHRTDTQSRAENYVRWHYKNKSLPKIEKEMLGPCTIEDCNFVDERGQQYVFRISNQIIGYIWFFDDEEWDNHEEYWLNSDGKKYDDWRDCGLALAKTIRNDLYQQYQQIAA